MSEVGLREDGVKAHTTLAESSDDDNGALLRGVTEPKSPENASLATRRPRSKSIAQTPFQKTLEEYERKMAVLSHCLEEKAEENVTLYEQLQKAEENARKKFHQKSSELERLLLEMSQTSKAQEEESSSLRATLLKQDEDIVQLKSLNSEFDRRIQALTVCLEEVIQENGKMRDANERLKKLLQQQSQTLGPNTTHHPSPATEKRGVASLFRLRKSQEVVPHASVEKSLKTQSESYLPAKPDQDCPVLSASTPSASSAGDEIAHSGGAHHLDSLLQEVQKGTEERKRAEEQLSKLRGELEETKVLLEQKEKRIVSLNTKLMQSVNKEMASEESNELYEKKLKELEKEHRDDLHKVEMRRAEEEYITKKLRKKVAELQFLLDERDDDDDDDSEEESEEEGEDTDEDSDDEEE